MTLFSDRIYTREHVMELSSEPIIPEDAFFKIDIGFDRNKKNDWKKKDYRPKPVLIRGDDAWTSDKLKLDKTKVDEISNNIKKLLNKISDKNYEKILEQIMTIDINEDIFCLNVIVKEIFEKAILEPSFSKIYAKICIQLIEKYKNFQNIDFKRLLIAHCQKFFSDRDISNLDEYNSIIKKKKIIGNALFISELCTLDIISIDVVINECIFSLINEQDKLNNKNMEINMEIINNILIRCGKKFDETLEKKEKLNEIINIINNTVKELKLSSRIKFMFMDLNDLRKKGWNSKK